MTVFYDPKKRKSKPWIFASLIILPVVLAVFGFIIGKQYAEKKKTDVGKEVKDIFKQ